MDLNKHTLMLSVVQDQGSRRNGCFAEQLKREMDQKVKAEVRAKQEAKEHLMDYPHSEFSPGIQGFPHLILPP